MRTNTAVLGAAAFAVGALSSATAQNVYSVNVVGYVNVPIAHGFQILGNPLNAADNSINGLFTGGSNTAYVGPWQGCTVYTWNGGFVPDQLDTYGAGWANPNTQIPPGAGIFVKNPNAAFTNTFVGTVVQGGSTNVLGNNFTLVSSTWPVGTNVLQLGLNTALGDTIYTYDPVHGYYPYHLDTYGAGWSSPPAPAPQADTVNGPAIGVGQGFFYVNKTGSPFNWIQNFTVQ